MVNTTSSSGTHRCAIFKVFENTAINFIINEDSADILFRVFQNGFY